MLNLECCVRKLKSSSEDMFSKAIDKALELRKQLQKIEGVSLVDYALLGVT